MDGVRIEMMGCTDVLLREIESGEVPQRSVALTYCLAMRSSEPTDWARVNAAIIKRWSLSGLDRVKKMAWKFHAGESPNG